MWLVKLGGSLATSARLKDWLTALAEHGGGRAVVVPGGGPFADAVRETQHRWAYADSVAHVMAIYAMLQYGLMLEGLERRLLTARSIAAIRAAWAERRVPVWLPVPMALTDASIEASWRMTGDSLALWLAERLAIKRIALVKSLAVTSTAVDELSRQNIVDPLFADYARRSGGRIYCLGPDEPARLAAALRDDTPPGTAINYRGETHERPTPR